MHLQALSGKHKRCKVWLEERGKRVFKPVGDWPPALRRALEEYLAVPGHREAVELRWITLMINKGWLTVSYDAPYATLHAYPGTRDAFERKIDLRIDAPSPRDFAAIHRGNIALSADKCALVLLTDRDPGHQLDVRLESQVFSP